MSNYYNAQKTRGLYEPKSKDGFRLSRTKIDLFLNCPRCLYLNLRLGVSQPPGYPFSLNNAVDYLLKKEFDIHRAQNKIHPLMEQYNIDAVPLDHKDLEEWRNPRKGITYHHKPTNFIITGGIDDVWLNPKGEFIIVDYKATSKAGEVDIDADWQIGYKRQLEIYQWLFRQNNFKVDTTGYFVYCNGNTDKQAFDAKLEFDIKIIPYKGDDSWIEQEIFNIYKCINQNKLPSSGKDCDFCQYVEAVKKVGA